MAVRLYACACHLKISLERTRAPEIVADRDATLAVFRRFCEMQARGATVMYGDTEFWKTAPQAPVWLG